MGVANGLATLDSTGKVPSSQLPSYVDDVIEGYYHGEEDPQSGETVYNMYEDDEYTILITPESGKIYLDIPTSNSYRWSGSQYVLIGAPYDLPVASSSTLGGVKVGSNLSIDQNGVLSAADAVNEVQIGGETPSSDSDVEIFIDTTEDATAEVYTKQQQDGKFVVIKDLSTAPTESTLTYTENGTVKNFKQGDEVRVPDAEADNGYTFYKLYALSTESGVTTATWDKLGAGGAPVNPNETVNISLTQVGGNSADLTGASITITDDDSGDTLYTGTWAGTILTTEIDVNTNYTVSVETISGYIACADQSYQAGYQTERSITFQYKALGAFVEATDGTLYTASTWASSGKTANAVVLITSNHSLRVALVEAVLSITQDNVNPTAVNPYYPTIKDETQATNDFDGEGNTQKIRDFTRTISQDTSTYAATYCALHTFTYGNKSSYMPAYGQVLLIVNNKTIIDNCLEVCGGTKIKTAPNGSNDNAIWSSTRGENHPSLNSARFWKNGTYTGTDNASWKDYVRPVADYE